MMLFLFAFILLKFNQDEKGGLRMEIDNQYGAGEVTG